MPTKNLTPTKPIKHQPVKSGRKTTDITNSFSKTKALLQVPLRNTKPQPLATKENSQRADFIKDKHIDSSAVTDSFTSYLKVVSRYSVLCQKEELRLIKLSRGKDAKKARQAYETLILSNLRLVIAMAKKYTRFGCPIEDLVAEGNIGLQTAIDKYEPQRGAKLSTYAIWWIKQHLRKAISETVRTVRIPIGQQKTVRAIHAAAAKLYEITGAYPSDEEIASEIGEDTLKVQNLRNLTVPMLSLQTPIGDHSGKTPRTYEDILSDQSGSGETPLEKLTRKNSSESLLKLIEIRLNKREQDVIRMRFGLLTGEERPKTLEEVGSIMGLTRERIRQLQDQALKKLKRTLQAQDACEATLMTIKPEQA